MLSSLFKAKLLLFTIVATGLAQTDLTKLYTEAQQAQAAGDLATATRRYEAIVQQQPQMAEAYANLGNLYYQQGQSERAKEAYRKALKLKPALAGPQFFLGVIAFGDHDYAAALNYLQRAAVDQEGNPLIYAYLGYTHYGRSEFREATDALEKAAALNAADIDVLYHLSKSYGHLAHDSFSQLQSRFPGSVYTLLARAHLDETKEDWQAAEKDYTAALQKMPDNERLRQKARWAAAKAAGSTPAENGAPDELIDASLAYKDAPPAGPRLREEMTRWQVKIHGFPTPAKDDKELYLTAEGFQILAYLSSVAVFELDADSYRAHQLRAQLFEESNNDAGAIGEYREALKRKPDLPNMHFAIGSLLWKDQKFEDAWAELQQELKANPKQVQALYEAGDICAYQGRAPEAEKYFLEALKLDPSMTEAHLALEKIYSESGQYDKSLYHLRAALKTDPTEATTHYRLARVYQKTGHAAEAEKELAIFNQHRSQANQNGSSILK